MLTVKRNGYAQIFQKPFKLLRGLNFTKLLITQHRVHLRIKLSGCVRCLLVFVTNAREEGFDKYWKSILHDFRILA